MPWRKLGHIFVADGHTGGGTAVGNARVVKFDKTGKFLKTWGKKGMGPGELDVPHRDPAWKRDLQRVAERWDVDAEGLGHRLCGVDLC